jgi:hypothetical protein
MVSPPPGKPYVKELFGNEYREGEIVDGVARDGGGVVTPRDVEKEGVESGLKAL